MILQFFGPIVPGCTGAPLSGGEPMCTICDFLSLIDNVVKFITVLAPLLVVIFIIWGAFLIITAAGNTSRMVKGRQVIVTAVVGMLIVLGAWLITSTTFLIITGAYEGPLPLPWYSIRCGL